MILDKLLEQDPEDVFIYLERRVNEKVFPADIDEIYRPHGSSEKFNMPFVLLNSNETECFEVNPDRNVIEELSIDRKLKFFIHPAMIDTYHERCLKRLLSWDGYVCVSPTSSTRTVLVRNLKNNFMIKTDLEKKVGENMRRLKKSHLDFVRKIGFELEGMTLPSRFSYLPESYGLVYHIENEEVGMLIREFKAKPQIKEKSYLLPFFSLYSIDTMSEKDPLLLHQVLERLSKSGSNEFDLFIENILMPYLNSWAHLFLERGLVSEMHAQNALLEIDDKGNPSRIVCRDLQDFFVDADIRRFRGLSLDFNRNVVGDTNKKYKVDGKVVTDREMLKKISHSFTYDYRIGRALDLFSVAMQRYDSNAEERIKEVAKNIWVNHFFSKGLFPTKAYFPKPNEGIDEQLVFTEVRAKYRP